MSRTGNFVLRGDGGLVMLVQVQSGTPPVAIADMLEDAATSFRNRMTDIDSNVEALPVGWDMIMKLFYTLSAPPEEVW